MSKRKSHRGRPKGAVSYIGASLEDLNKVLKPDAVVLVDRRYAAFLAANGIEPREVAADVKDVIASSAPVEVKVS